MSIDKSINLAFRRWSAWAPGLTDATAWRAWANGQRDLSDEGAPDVGFVEPIMRRRLSRVSRMAFRVAADCLNNAYRAGALVFCSRYGEYTRTFDILSDITAGNPVSAAAFSTSVHNTASSLFAIHCNEHAPSTVISGNEASLETACLHANSLLKTGSADSVLVVYHDEPLPPLYNEQPTSVYHAHALAFLLEPPEGATHSATRLRLTWEAKSKGETKGSSKTDAALRVIRLCLVGGDNITIDTGRLRWHWGIEHAAA